MSDGLPSDLQRPVVLHVGMHKTGTSALQRYVFPSLPTVRCHARNGPGFSRAFIDLSNNLQHASDEDYRPDDLRAFLQDTVGDGSGPLVLSDEGFSGSYWLPEERGLRNAARLHRLFPTAKVLITVREQGALVRSAYAQYVHKGGPRSFSGFLDRAGPAHEFRLEHLEFHRWAAAYQDLFGIDRVLVAPHESLVADPPRFVADLADFIGVDAPADLDVPPENRSLSPASRAALLLVNRVARRSPFNPDPYVPIARADRARRFLQREIDPRFFSAASRSLRRRDEAVIESLRPRYSASNSELEQRTGLRLAELGYATSDASGRPTG